MLHSPQHRRLHTDGRVFSSWTYAAPGNFQEITRLYFKWNISKVWKGLRLCVTAAKLVPDWLFEEGTDMLVEISGLASHVA